MKKNYPLYEATQIRDFRALTEDAAEKYSDKTAYSYKPPFLIARVRPGREKSQESN